MRESLLVEVSVLPSRRRLLFKDVTAHLDAAYNLARWLTGDSSDADDVVQEAYIKAWRHFDGFKGGDSKAWLLSIVRNAAYTWLRQNRRHARTVAFDEGLHSPAAANTSPERASLAGADLAAVKRCLMKLPVEAREIVVLRDLEGFSYQEIAALTGLVPGTVMSRLSRARARLMHEMRADQQLQVGGASNHEL